MPYQSNLGFPTQWTLPCSTCYLYLMLCDLRKMFAVFLVETCIHIGYGSFSSLFRMCDLTFPSVPNTTTNQFLFLSILNRIKKILHSFQFVRRSHLTSRSILQLKLINTLILKNIHWLTLTSTSFTFSS